MIDEPREGEGSRELPVPRPAAVLWSGVALVAAPLLSVFAMAQHPSPGAAGTAARLAEITRQTPLIAAVHGGLIALIVAIYVALLTVAAVLGWGSGRVRAGAAVYGIGVVCMVGAALVSGFVVPGLAAHFDTAPAAAMEAAVPSFRLAHGANQALAGAGAMAMSVGILAFSLALLGRGRFARGVGLFGLAVGAAPIVGLLLGRLTLDVHGMMALTLAQSGWTVAVGVWLLARRRGS